MQKPDIPADEPARIAALCNLEILDTPPEERFDRITRITQRHFAIPIALISLVDSGRQWFKSRQGLDATETPRDLSFCGHAILGDDIFYIPDALADSRFSDNPLVTCAPHVRFYAGAPLHAPDGERIGTLCIIDDQPREFSRAELSILRDLADCVEEELRRYLERQASQKLQDQEQRFSALVNTIVDGIIVIDGKGRIQTLNPAAIILFGYAPDEVQGQNIKMLMPGPYASEHDGYLHNYLTTGIKKVIGIGREVTGKRKDGSTFPMELAVSEMEVAGERMFTGIVRDITERKRSEAEIQARENRIRALVDTIVDGIVVIDAKGHIQTLNPAAVKLFGYLAEEVQGQNIKMLMPGPYAGEHDGYLHNYLTTGIKKVIGIGREVTGKRKDGSTFPMELAVSEMEVAGERMFTGIIRDITERKRSEEMLLNITALRQALLDSANFTIISTDSNGTIQSFNRCAERMLGYSAEEMVGRCSPAIIHDIDEIVIRAKELSVELGRTIEPGFEAFVTKARLGIPDEREWTYIRKDRSRFPVLLSITAVWGAEGNIIGFLGVGSDITERKKTERIQSEFISTVSHELRTPLTSIKGALGLVLGMFAAQLPEKALHMLEMAERNSERLTLLINDILDLEKIEAGRLAFDFKMVDLVALARRALEDNEGFARKHQVRLILDHDITFTPIWADEYRLLQVFANLISNAVKYSSQNGEVVVSVFAYADGFRVEVKDRGPGIPEVFRSRIFQRFAQADSSDTREKGGTGLGLSITKAIIERHEGKIDYTTAVGVGTVFFFDLPALRDVVETIEKGSTEGRALICEDSPDVAHILADMVQQEGVVCDIAASAAGARSLLAKHAYRLMLLDLTLPDADGLVFLQELRANVTTAKLPVIVVSGRAQEGRVAFSGDALTVVDWIQKPIGKQRLAQALQDALSRTKRPHILHVEDDSDIVQIVQVLLDGVADMTYVNSLQNARQQLADQNFDLVILDLALVDGSGLELLAELKGRCPVLIFSAQIPDRNITDQVAAALIKSMTSNAQLLGTIRRILNVEDTKP